MQTLAQLWRRARRRVRRQRTLQLESLEDRRVLNAMPLAVHDAGYSTPLNTALVVGSSSSILNNDWDPEGSSLTASVVTNPANGTLSNFSGSAGTFTYTPNQGFAGIDSFSYKASDGTKDSNVVTVSIAVGDHFGPRTNLEEATRGSLLRSGATTLAAALTPGLELFYNSLTAPKPIIVLETFLMSSSSVPDEIQARLTFNGTAGTTYSYSTSGLAAGDSLRFALQADATSLATGRYAYTVRLTARFGSTYVDRDYSGFAEVVNRGQSTHEFGRGWQLAGLDKLVSATGGMLLVRSTGDALWFADNGSGGYQRAAGDESFSTLVQNGDGSFTLTDKHGYKQSFSSGGLLTSRVDRNSNTISYSYTGGQLTQITDPFGRNTTFTYTSGQLTSVTDFASRTATLAYDGSSRLTSVTQPDPDGAGSQTSPVTSFSYNATSHLLTQVTDPVSRATQFSYGSHGRLATITNADSTTRQLTSLQTIGLPTGTTGNSLTSANPQGTLTDERGKHWKFRTDRYGNLTEWKNPNSYTVTSERNQDGLLARLTQPDPDGGGPLGTLITRLGYDSLGNQVYQKNPDGAARSWTYTSAFNQVASATDEIARSVSFSYNSTGDLTTATDGAGFSTTYAYNSRGQVTSVTAPDPDGTGPKTASVTQYAYDSYGRLTTITHPGSVTETFAYNTADNLTSATDELGNSTSFSYDALNRLTSITDRENAVTSYTYNSVGEVTKVTDPLGYATDYEYSNRGFLTKIIRPDPDGTGPLGRPEMTYGYDATGNVTSEGSYEWTAGASITHSYDDAGRRTSTSGPLSGATKYFSVDALGRVSMVTDAATNTTSYEYNFRGQVTKVSGNDPDGSGPATGPVLASYTYDAAGQPLSSTDARGYVTDFVFDARGLIKTVYLPDPDGSGPQWRPWTSYVHDNAGRMTKVEDHLGRATTYDHDSRNRVTSVTLPDPDGTGPLAAPVTTYAYNAASRVTSGTDPLSRVTSYTHDKEGRLKTVTQPDPDGAGPLSSPVISYAYNAVGSLTSMTDALGNVTSYEYDGWQRQTKITQADPDGTGPLTAPVTTLVYSAQGVLDKITDPISRDTTFEYDSIGRRTGITDELGQKTTLAYNNRNLVTSVTAPDPDGAGPLTAPVTSYSYDAYHRVTAITDPLSGTTQFTYDDAGNLLTLRDPVNNTTTFTSDCMRSVGCRLAA
jgi:YD repeat-containing protein